MIERAVQRAEEGAPRRSVVGIGELPRRLVEALVTPAIVGCKHCEMGLHGTLRVWQGDPTMLAGD